MCSDRNLNSNCDWDLPSTGVCIHMYVRASLLRWRHAWVLRLAYHRLLVCHLFRDDCCEMRAQRSQHATAAVLDYCQYRVCTCGSWRDVVWPVLAWDGPDCVICSEQVPSNCASWWWSADWVCVYLSVCLYVCVSACGSTTLRSSDVRRASRHHRIQVRVVTCLGHSVATVQPQLGSNCT